MNVNEGVRGEFTVLAHLLEQEKYQSEAPDLGDGCPMLMRKSNDGLSKESAGKVRIAEPEQSSGPSPSERAKTSCTAVKGRDELGRGKGVS